MRTVTYGGAVSLDGYLAAADGSIDWLHFSKDAQQAMAEEWQDIDTILMGRKTYVMAEKRNPEKPKSAKQNMPQFQTYVFSRTLKTIDDPSVHLVADDVAEFTRKLKRAEGKKIFVIGGGELAQPLLAAGLIDKLYLNIHPILLGSGVPTIRDLPHRVKLTLTACRQLEGGCLRAHYNVLHAK